MNKRTLIVLVAALAIALAGITPAEAKVSGINGRLAYARFDPSAGDSFTYTVDTDGTDVQPLLTGFTSEMPRWSPDGSEVAIVSGLGVACPPTCTGNTVIVNPATGSSRVLASQGYPAVSTFCSIWSPDASHFACEGGNDDDPSVRGIYTIRANDGGGLTRITSSGDHEDIPIDYSPDGRQIVFGRLSVTDHGCDSTAALYVVNVDGTGLRRITPWGFCDDDGSWSPNGREIAFEHRGSLFVVHPDGTGMARIPLATTSRLFGGDVSWSPDAKKITFILGTVRGPGTFAEGIATANADGSNVHLVAPSPTFDNQPDWGATGG